MRTKNKEALIEVRACNEAHIGFAMCVLKKVSDGIFFNGSSNKEVTIEFVDDNKFNISIIWTDDRLSESEQFIIKKVKRRGNMYYVYCKASRFSSFRTVITFRQ